MEATDIKSTERCDKAYVSRCINELKRMDAPLSGWKCVYITDTREDDDNGTLETCELCGCTKVRYVHTMYHEHFFMDLNVGCICAGIMEGDILAAEEREREMRNRSQRRRRFATGAWKRTSRGFYTRRYKRQNILVHEVGGTYVVQVGRKVVSKYKGKPITDILSAGYAAYDLIDPAKGIG